MPELAETLRISTDIANLNLGKLKSVDVLDTRCFENQCSAIHLPFKNDHVIWYGSGKYIILMQVGLRIAFRLSMSGRFIAEQYMNDVDKRHIIFDMSFDNGKLYYVDYRRFSRINIVTQEFVEKLNRYTLLSAIGREAFKNSFEITKITKKPKIAEMLDEGRFTGIGNYLANESLAIADISPYTPFENEQQKEEVYLIAQNVALNSYAAGGNTFNGGYKRVNGESGNYKCKYYGNEEFRKAKFRGRPIFTSFSPSSSQDTYLL